MYREPNKTGCHEMERSNIVRPRGHGRWYNCVKEDLKILRLMNREKIYGFTWERHHRSGNDSKRLERMTLESRGKSCSCLVEFNKITDFKVNLLQPKLL